MKFKKPRTSGAFVFIFAAMGNGILIEQFYDKGLSHSSYAILSGRDVFLIDPARDPQPYYAFARLHTATIKGVIETHPHADFVSAHLQIHKETGATIYTSKLTDAAYPHQSFDDGDEICSGNLLLFAINTPGHSPDSISILLIENHHLKAVFTGDTLFAGDVGRPDLREQSGAMTASKQALARALYHSTRNKLMTLAAGTIVYPSHGPGSLCGKHLSPELSSTIGHELRYNYALQQMTEDAFVKLITDEQPFIPKYFPYDVELNKKGAEEVEKSMDRVPVIPFENRDQALILVDTRSADQFKAGHAEGAINIPDDNSFETWLGSIIAPQESYYLLAEGGKATASRLAKAAKIGYEKNAKGTIVYPQSGNRKSDLLDLHAFKTSPGKYTIIDIRNESEVKAGKIFKNSLAIPLPVLREQVNRIPKDKPIVVHCAGGYRSAIGSSIISRALPGCRVYDLGSAIETFK